MSANYLKGYRLDLSHRLGFVGPIRHDAGQVRYRRQDTTILLRFQFDANGLNLDHIYANILALWRQNESPQRPERRNVDAGSLIDFVHFELLWIGVRPQ